MTPTPESLERARKWLEREFPENGVPLDSEINSLALEFDRIAVEAKIAAYNDVWDNSGAGVDALVFVIERSESLRKQLAAHTSAGEGE